MKVLIIHHLEPMWDTGYSYFGETFASLQELFCCHLAEHKYDKVILTRFEDWKATSEEGYFEEFLSHISEVKDYAYGWEREEMENDPENFCEGGSHSGAVLITDWMRKLKNAAQVVIAGAFDGECIEDLEIALGHLGVDFKREESLII